MELWQFLGTLHPKLVQFPLVLLLMGLLFDGVGAFWKSSRARWAGLVTSAAGTLGLLVAFICGIYAEIWAGRAGVPQHPIELHELLANVASWGFVILFAWRILLGDFENEKSGSRNPKLKWLRVYVCTGLVWYVLLVVTGYLGGQLVFEYGAGAGAGQHSSALSLEDLNTLAARQTDLNLRYSEWMHHVFGAMTVGLGASLLAQAIWPAQKKRLAWIVPAFLLAGGVFLFFSADLDLYKFTDLHQWRDREVQLHKVIALAMTAAGVVGMVNIVRGIRKARAMSGMLSGISSPHSAGEGFIRAAEHGTRSNTEIENQKSDIGNDSNSRLVAVVALIGGSLLFTHVHTVAPYANVAAGVYIFHVVMGLVALSIGATRVAQDYLPRWRRELSVAFALFMLIEAGLLITYNEGLPWFIGYGRYDRWGYGDEQQRRLYTVAPFGNFRALLNITPEDGRVHVGMRTRFAPSDDHPELFGTDGVALPLDAAPVLLVNAGDGDVALPLAKGVENGKASDMNFEGQADFLKTAPFVSARLLLSIGGKRQVGYFDPWVTPRIVAVPANDVATYVCPMHEGVRATDETYKDLDGKCPICGMELVKIKPRLPAGELHDPEYAMTAQVEAMAGRPLSAAVHLVVKDNGNGDVKLTPMHEQLMHLAMVSEDLRYFDHVHPVLAPGHDSVPPTYTLAYTFPRAGRYVLFADFTPKGDRAQVMRVPLMVDEKGVRLDEGATTEAARLGKDEGGKLVIPVPMPRTPQDSAALDLGAASKPAAILPAPVGAALAGPSMEQSMARQAPVLAEMVSLPHTIYAGLHTELRFRLSDAEGHAITDLMPYLAAAGHCNIVSADGQIMLHCHPEDVMGVGADWRGGPEVVFGVEFPKAGRYRVWGQFRRGAGLIIVPYDVEVPEPPVPAGVIRTLLNEP